VKRNKKTVVLLIAGGLFALPMLFVAFLYLMFCFGPEKKTPWIYSPDGQWSAQVRIRATPNANNSRLFLRYQNDRPKEVSRVWGYNPTLRWSPTSEWIAGADEGLDGIWVYDVRSGHYADVWLHISRVSADGNSMHYQNVKWGWQRAKYIVIYDEVTGTSDQKVLYTRRLAEYEVKDTNSALRVCEVGAK